MSTLISSALLSFMDMPANVDRRMICPECDPRRRHKGKKDLAIKRVDKGLIYKCHHCDVSGLVKEEEYTPPKRKSVVAQPDMRSLTPEAIIWLRDRQISKSTAVKAGCFSTTFFSRQANANVQAIGFPYRNSGVTYASKLRALSIKDHIQIGACQTFWQSDMIGDLDCIYITEGEPDCLAMMEAGYTNVISVPNGAPSQHLAEVVGKDNDRKFSYIWNSEKLLEQVDKIYLCGDNDRPGAILSDELARRIGKHKCWKVTWPDSLKDANATLMEHGPEGVVGAVRDAERYPVAGLYEADNFYNEVKDLYANGAGSGKSTGYHCLDGLFTVLPGTLTIVTGIPSSGKSELLDQLVVNLAEKENWMTAFASFENEPRFHIAKLMSKKTGKQFFVGPSPRMDKAEADVAMKWVNDNFVFIYQADGSMATMDDIIERLTVAVVRYGIRVAVIDPFNYIERETKEQNETQWIGDVLTRLRVFAQSHDVATFLVAHPKMMQRGDKGVISPPRGYDISGSAHFNNKADFGITIHPEPEDRSIVNIINWKTRFAWAGRQGETQLIYNLKTTLYEEPPLGDFFNG